MTRRELEQRLKQLEEKLANLSALFSAQGQTGAAGAEGSAGEPGEGAVGQPGETVESTVFEVTEDGLVTEDTGWEVEPDGKVKKLGASSEAGLEAIGGITQTSVTHKIVTFQARFKTLLEIPAGKADELYAKVGEKSIAEQLELTNIFVAKPGSSELYEEVAEITLYQWSGVGRGISVGGQDPIEHPMLWAVELGGLEPSTVPLLRFYSFAAIPAEKVLDINVTLVNLTA